MEKIVSTKIGTVTKAVGLSYYKNKEAACMQADEDGCHAILHSPSFERIKPTKTHGSRIIPLGIVVEIPKGYYITLSDADVSNGLTITSALLKSSNIAELSVKVDNMNGYEIIVEKGQPLAILTIHKGTPMKLKEVKKRK